MFINSTREEGYSEKESHVREYLAGVDSQALAVEVGVAHAVRVVVTAVGVTLAGEAVLGVGSAAVVSLADVVAVLGAGVRGEGKGVRVGLPGKRG